MESEDSCHLLVMSGENLGRCYGIFSCYLALCLGIITYGVISCYCLRMPDKFLWCKNVSGSDHKSMLSFRWLAA
jgi:hypothetical protein